MGDTDPRFVPEDVPRWLAILDSRLGGALRSWEYGDAAATLNHARAAAEAACCAALAACRIEPAKRELQQLQQQLRTARLPVPLSEAARGALDEVRLKGNLGSHANTDDAERLERAARSVLGEMPSLVEWLYDRCLERPRSPEVCRFLECAPAAASAARPSRRVFRRQRLAAVVALAVFAACVAAAFFVRTGDAATCTLVPVGEFHLRPRETCESIGPELRVTETLQVLAHGALLRAGTRQFKVRLPASGREGWLFARPDELRGACPVAWRGDGGGVPCRQRPTRERCQPSMAFVGGGRFVMGRDDGPLEERPAHDVTLSPYCVDRTEVTAAQYRACVDAGQCSDATLEGARTVDPTGPCTAHADGADVHPINCVTWHQARGFCEWAGGRLPTEAEWERVARELTPGASPVDVGANVCGDECVARYPSLARFPEHHDAFAATAPVGSFGAGRTARGIDDLLGNVWEWAEDGFGSYTAGDARDPVGDPASRVHVARGGGWRHSDPSRLTATAREPIAPDYASPNLGFRCVSRR